MNDIKFRAGHFCAVLLYLAVLGWLALVFQEHQKAITIVALLPFLLTGILIFAYLFQFVIEARISLAWEWLADTFGKFIPRGAYLPKKNGKITFVPKRSDSPFGTALEAMLSSDKRDLLYFLAAGRSKERYFILRDISDKRLEWCMKKLGYKTPQVVFDAWEERVCGTKPKFDRGEEGKVL